MFLDMNYLNRTGWIIVICYAVLRPEGIYYQEQK